MLKELVQFLIDTTKPTTEVIDGRTYLSRAPAPIKPPLPEALVFASLTGLVDFCKTIPGAAAEDHLLHVVDPDRVELVWRDVDAWKQRGEVARATTDQHADNFAFGNYMDQEQFIIGVRSLFVPTPDTDKLLSVVGSMSASSTVNVEDDGVSQSVGLKAGILLKSRETLPPRIVLQPYRTFREAIQPQSEFIVRVRQEREGSVPKIALFEADGGAWRLQAVKNVATVLVKELPGWKVLA